MTDKLTEVAKNLGRTKRNSEAALRRYATARPKIERVRDSFGPVVPFEMEFEIEDHESTMRLDLYFNKPPPGCKGPREFGMCCETFEVEYGGHLIRIANGSYISGTLTIFNNGYLQTLGVDYEERDPEQGFIFVMAKHDTTNIIDICYLTESRTTEEWSGTLFHIFEGFDNGGNVATYESPPDAPFDVAFVGHDVLGTIESWIHVSPETYTGVRGPLPAVWEVVAVLYKYHSITYSDGTGVHTLNVTTPDSDIDDTEASLNQFVSNIFTYSKGWCKINLTVIKPSRTLTSLTWMGETTKYAIRLNDISPDLDGIVYDAAIAVYQDTDGGSLTIPRNWAGLTINGDQLSMSTYTDAINPDGELFTHEWAHQALEFYASTDLTTCRMTTYDLDRAGELGYVNDPEVGYRQFIVDTLTGKVTIDSVPNSSISSDAWRRGTPLRPYNPRRYAVMFEDAINNTGDVLEGASIYAVS